MNKKPIYLLKFVSKEEHANDFLNGELFTYPAGYYRYLERGRGDNKEGLVIGSSLYRTHPPAFQNTSYSIFCMYAVCRDDVDSNGVIKNIDERCIKDFKAQNGYVIAIKCADMTAVINSCDTQGYNMESRMIEYRDITFDDTWEWTRTGSVDNLFIKCPCFAYQNEFRTVICKNNRYDFAKNEFGGIKLVYQPQKYRFSFDIKEKAKKYPICNMYVGENNKYSLKLDL